ncbi:hypothetical protein [Streptomyces spiralis]|uniref:hypothetical protein n=1 Tax=Streptomyces spiralis TaxID=66376 RepID=UPI0036C9DB95
MSTPFERLMAEAIPTRPPAAPKPEQPPPREPGHWTPEEQDTHWAELCQAIGVTNERRPTLRLITEPEPATDSDAA